MIADRHPDPHEPLTYWGRIPVYATTLLVVAHVTTMILTSLLLASGAGGFLARLTFIPAAVLQHFEVWRAVTYAFVNEPSLWFAVEMFLLYIFGREVEKFIGRRAFLAMYGVFLLTIPLVLTVLSFIGPAFASNNLNGFGFSGSSAVQFAVFVAFCTIYPNAQFFFGISAKWIALILLSINSLQALTSHSWDSLTALWSVSAAAFFMLNRRRFDFDFLSDWRARRASRRALRPVPSPKTSRESDPAAEVDALLEKISRKGIASLTRSERQRLESARERLLEKEKSR